MIAIVSDIHGNLEALTAVLAEIDRRGIKQMVCLGDIIGYGPNPVECLDLVMARATRCLLGNHDFAVLYEPFNFNVGAESACYWTRQKLEESGNEEQRAKRWAFLGSLPTRLKEPKVSGGFEAVHASPRRPINEYIFPDDIYTHPGKFVAIFDRVERLCFCGHTHVPGLFMEGPDFFSPEELEWRYEFGPDGDKAIVNVGSVGQPRDRDPRSSFVVLHERAVEFVRVPYDIATTAGKVKAVAELDDFLGQRLFEGR
jgi:diadenosine tetraphosphatase ApaH/serine/threonine PP2A family protein phosphatase